MKEGTAQVVGVCVVITFSCRLLNESHQVTGTVVFSKSGRSRVSTVSLLPCSLRKCKALLLLTAASARLCREFVANLRAHPKFWRVVRLRLN